MALQYGNGRNLNVEMGGPYGSAAPNARISEITIKASAWKGATSPYYQTVLLENMSVNSKVDQQPSVDQLKHLCAANIALTTENDSGVLTVYSIGSKPASDMTVQVSITEVTRDGEIIRGNTVGAVAPVTDYAQTDSQNPDFLKGRESIAKAVQQAGDALLRTGGIMTGTLDMGGRQIANVPDPEAEADAANKKYVDGKIKIETAILTAAGWSEGAPYSQSVAVTGVTAEKPPHVSPDYSADNAPELMEAAACVTYATAGTDMITFVCLRDKPQVDIPIQVEVHR